MKRLIRNTILFLIAIFIFPLLCSSQDLIKIDSLTSLLKESPDDSLKVQTLQHLYWEYRRTDPDKALAYAYQSLKLSQSVHYTKGIANSLHYIGIIQKVLGKYDTTYLLLQEAKKYYHEINDTVGIVACLTDIGDIYYMQNNYQLALEYLEEARNLITKTGNKEKLSRIYSKLGGIYNLQKQFEKALEYHRKSLEINEGMDFKLGMSVNYNNIGNVYLDLKQYQSAEENYLKSLEIKKEITDNAGIGSILNNLGLISSGRKDFNKALDYHTQALEIFEKMGDKPGIATCQTNIANDFLVAGNYHKSIEYAKLGLTLSEEISLKRTQTEIYRILSEAHAALSQFEEAYQYQKLYKIYHDSTVNVEAVRQITEMESKFEVEKKEKEIALLNSESEKSELKMKQQRSQRNLMIGLTVLVLIILGILIRNFRNKQKLNTRLKELNLIKSRFFANISHEFRTPLTLLLGPIEKLMDNAKQEDKEMIGMMHRNATRLLFLDNQLLDLSKLEAGKLSLQVVQSEMIQALKGMVTSFHSFAEKKKINFTYVFPNQKILAFFDQDKLEKIVYNLLSNALKFTPENGRVIFELTIISNNKRKELPQKIRKIPGRLVCISIKDTGPGIATDHLPYIFDRFYQVDSRQNRSFEGTGLGLSLSKELVELHHGRILVESELGKGSNFNVFLPIDKIVFAPAEITINPNSTKEVSASTANIQIDDRNTITELETASEDIESEELLKVLLVEDNPDMRLYIRDCFPKQFHIVEAGNGIEGFEAAIAETPDVIITDLMMPKMDGIELCQKLKTDERTSHIPLILLTALSSVEDRIHGLETGADDYISKPFNRKELITRVQNLTEQRKLLRKRFGKEVKIQAKDITVTSADEKFLNTLISFIENNLADPDLNVDSLIGQINLSRSQLHRKLKALTDLSTTEFVRTIRLKRAAQLLEQNHGTIAETVYAVGFSSLSYFSKCFQKQFNMTPKEYIEQS
ncbi:MAG: tetratricopeptide repeat protein [Bacteroidales bacterium]|nr:tetratricopeptide repeat protein [Bacteroidales bacterium]